MNSTKNKLNSKKKKKDFLSQCQTHTNYRKQSIGNAQLKERRKQSIAIINPN